MSAEFSQAESIIGKLSESEQLLLLERLAQTLRTTAHRRKRGSDASVDQQLAAMAADPQIRAELDRIEHDFAETEFDGLADK